MLTPPVMWRSFFTRVGKILLVVNQETLWAMANGSDYLPLPAEVASEAALTSIEAQEDQSDRARESLTNVCSGVGTYSVGLAVTRKAQHAKASYWPALPTPDAARRPVVDVAGFSQACLSAKTSHRLRVGPPLWAHVTLKSVGVALTTLGITQGAFVAEVSAASLASDGAFDLLGAALLFASPIPIVVGVTVIMVAYFTAQPAD